MGWYVVCFVAFSGSSHLLFDTKKLHFKSTRFNGPKMGLVVGVMAIIEVTFCYFFSLNSHSLWDKTLTSLHCLVKQ